MGDGEAGGAATRKGVMRWESDWSADRKFRQGSRSRTGTTQITQIVIFWWEEEWRWCSRGDEDVPRRGRVVVGEAEAGLAARAFQPARGRRGGPRRSASEPAAMHPSAAHDDQAGISSSSSQPTTLDPTQTTLLPSACRGTSATLP